MLLLFSTMIAFPLIFKWCSSNICYLQDGCTPLLLGFKSGLAEAVILPIIKALIEAKADVNAKDKVDQGYSISFVAIRILKPYSTTAWCCTTRTHTHVSYFSPTLYQLISNFILIFIEYMLFDFFRMVSLLFT
jgi:hypothetical protein